MADPYNTINDVRRGTDVPLPKLDREEQFVLLKVNEDGTSTVTLFNLTPSAALDALMGVAMALNG